ncbi:hypothetical protein H6503_04090 [Candidatus Woesearchaeota archaeon]|nr:hypothetical protein [Candidatus Woesearchaeota archaeon]
MFSFNWPLIIATTAVLYVLTILALPFSPLFATIMLFSLIAFWTNLPGFCIMEPIRFLYMLDFVDIFTVFIAVHIGPFEAVAFTLFWNMYPRLCGAYLPWIAVFKDALLQAILALFVPLMYALTGGNIFAVVVIYSILRIPGYILISLILPHRSFPEQVFHCFAAGGSVLLINAFYTKFFGDFFDNLLATGTFSWMLFLIATVVIVIFSVTVLGFSFTKATRNISKAAVKIVKKNVPVKKRKDEPSDDEQKEISFVKESLKKIR